MGSSTLLGMIFSCIVWSASDLCLYLWRGLSDEQTLLYSPDSVAPGFVHRANTVEKFLTDMLPGPGIDDLSACPVGSSMLHFQPATDSTSSDPRGPEVLILLSLKLALTWYTTWHPNSENYTLIIKHRLLASPVPSAHWVQF
ncbi:hypothetical protein BDW62DRAFT_198166 [Aspergillus aurantiobrunneus]